MAVQFLSRYATQATSYAMVKAGYNTGLFALSVVVDRKILKVVTDHTPLSNSIKISPYLAAATVTLVASYCLPVAQLSAYQAAAIILGSLALGHLGEWSGIHKRIPLLYSALYSTVIMGALSGAAGTSHRTLGKIVLFASSFILSLPTMRARTKPNCTSQEVPSFDFASFKERVRKAQDPSHLTDAANTLLRAFNEFESEQPLLDTYPNAVKQLECIEFYIDIVSTYNRVPKPTVEDSDGGAHADASWLYTTKEEFQTLNISACEVSGLDSFLRFEETFRGIKALYPQNPS